MIKIKWADRAKTRMLLQIGERQFHVTVREAIGIARQVEQRLQKRDVHPLTSACTRRHHSGVLYPL